MGVVTYTDLNDAASDGMALNSGCFLPQPHQSLPPFFVRTFSALHHCCGSQSIESSKWFKSIRRRELTGYSGFRTKSPKRPSHLETDTTPLSLSLYCIGTRQKRRTKARCFDRLDGAIREVTRENTFAREIFHTCFTLLQLAERPAQRRSERHDGTRKLNCPTCMVKFSEPRPL